MPLPLSLLLLQANTPPRSLIYFPIGTHPSYFPHALLYSTHTQRDEPHPDGAGALVCERPRILFLEGQRPFFSTDDALGEHFNCSERSFVRSFVRSLVHSCVCSRCCAEEHAARLTAMPETNKEARRHARTKICKLTG